MLGVNPVFKIYIMYTWVYIMSKLRSDFIYNLIGKKLSGQISKTENDSLINWINSSKEAKKNYEEIKMQWSNIHFTYSKATLNSAEEIRDMIWEKAFKSKGLRIKRNK